MSGVHTGTEKRRKRNWLRSYLTYTRIYIYIYIYIYNIYIYIYIYSVPTSDTGHQALRHIYTPCRHQIQVIKIYIYTPCRHQIQIIKIDRYTPCRHQIQVIKIRYRSSRSDPGHQALRLPQTQPIHACGVASCRRVVSPLSAAAVINRGRRRVGMRVGGVGGWGGSGEE